MDPDFCGPSRTTSATELLKTEPRDLEVSDGRTVSIASREYEHHVFRVKVESFRDLQLLGLVPRGLAEDAVRKAIRGDDERTHTLAEQQFAQSASGGGCGCGCGCGNHESGDAHKDAKTNGRRIGLQSYVKAMRRDIHPNLTNLLSEHLRTHLDVASPYVRWTHYYVSAFDRRQLQSFISLLFQDIYIGSKATLSLPQTQKSLYARNITIHQTGRLVAGAAYTKIWANSISPPGIDLTKVVPWAIANF